MGHKDAGITQSPYQHAIPALEEEAIERFASLVDRAGSVSDRYQRTKVEGTG